ncbi:hypothetical protein QHF83_52750, partial [Polyangium sp. 15x6]|nr:hypothetical protein [Polyangium sp. 15x6]
NGAGGNGGSAGSGGAGGGTGGAGGGMGGTGGGAPAGGYCGKSCAMPADCCQGAPNCPGDYPFNYTCDNGVCGPGQCATDMECTFGGALPNNKCVAENGLKTCVTPCTADADCTMPLKCIGEDDSGAKYCTSEATGGCMSDADCNGYGKCNTTSKACECSADADCTGAGVDKCVQ